LRLLAPPVRPKDDQLAVKRGSPLVERVGTKAFEDAVRDLAMPVEFGLETMSHLIDWNRHVPFQVIRGEVECAS